MRSPIWSVIIRVIDKFARLRRGFANQVGLRTELDDTKSSYQLIITITLSEDLRKDKNLLKNSANSPFYDFASNFGV